MKRLIVPLSAALAALVLALGGCSEDDFDRSPPFVPSPAPLEMSEELRALPYAWFSTMEDFSVLQERFTARVDDVSALVWTQPLFSENRQRRINETAVYLDQEVRRQLEAPPLANALGELDRVYLVVELMRTDGTWLFDWQNRERHLEGARDSLNFGVQAYRDSVRDRIVEAVRELDVAEPMVVIGNGMERYFLLNPDDWQNFADFAREVRVEVREAVPRARVAVGIDWSNLVERVAMEIEIPEDVRLPEDFERTEEDGNVAFLFVNLAWEAVIEPLYFRMRTREGRSERVASMDFYAFSSTPDISLYGGEVDNLPSQHYAGIRTRFARARADVLPVAWTAVGWFGGGAPLRLAFFERFLRDNGGYDVELVAPSHFHQLVSNECNRLSEIGYREARCRDGFYQVSGQPVGGWPDAYFGR